MCCLSWLLSIELRILKNLYIKMINKRDYLSNHCNTNLEKAKLEYLNEVIKLYDEYIFSFDNAQNIFNTEPFDEDELKKIQRGIRELESKLELCEAKYKSKLKALKNNKHM